jgi:hypothetical protein
MALGALNTAGHMAGRAAASIRSRNARQRVPATARFATKTHSQPTVMRDNRSGAIRAIEAVKKKAPAAPCAHGQGDPFPVLLGQPHAETAHAFPLDVNRCLSAKTPKTDRNEKQQKKADQCVFKPHRTPTSRQMKEPRPPQPGLSR